MHEVAAAISAAATAVGQAAEAEAEAAAAQAMATPKPTKSEAGMRSSCLHGSEGMKLDTKNWWFMTYQF